MFREAIAEPKALTLLASTGDYGLGTPLFIVLLCWRTKLPLPRINTVKTLLRATLFLIVLVLQGCGTLFATVPNAQNEPVMLLGFDPTAYFTQAKPVRGSPEFKSQLPNRSYYFSSAENKALFDSDPAKYEPQYGGFCASGAAYAIKLGSDPEAWQIHQGRLFIFGDVLGKSGWQLDPQWNVDHADKLWPTMRDTGWRIQTLGSYVHKVAHYKSGAQIVTAWQLKNPSQQWPKYDTGGMLNNLFLKSPGWRAAEGFGQTALGYPK